MSSIISEQRTPQQTLPPIQCAPWCTDGDGHPGNWHPQDQYCTSQEIRVSLTREDPIEGYEEGTHMLDYVTTYLVHDRFEAEPHVQVAQNDLAGPRLTLAEAREYFQKGLLLVSAAEAALRS